MNTGVTLALRAFIKITDRLYRVPKKCDQVDEIIYYDMDFHTATYMYRRNGDIFRIEKVVNDFLMDRKLYAEGLYSISRGHSRELVTAMELMGGARDFPPVRIPAVLFAEARWKLGNDGKCDITKIFASYSSIPTHVTASILCEVFRTCHGAKIPSNAVDIMITYVRSSDLEEITVNGGERVAMIASLFKD
jgi:hypothetical protein